MKPTTPKRLWVTNKANGHTTVSKYYSAKRHNVATIKIRTMSEDCRRLAADIERYCYQTGRSIEWAGDTLPKNIMDAIAAARAEYQKMLPK